MGNRLSRNARVPKRCKRVIHKVCESLYNSELWELVFGNTRLVSIGLFLLYYLWLFMTDTAVFWNTCQCRYFFLSILHPKAHTAFSSLSPMRAWSCRYLRGGQKCHGSSLLAHRQFSWATVVWVPCGSCEPAEIPFGPIWRDMSDDSSNHLASKIRNWWQAH